MAFFDEIGKKITSAGQTAVQKTQEIAAIAKLNSSVSEEEKRMNNLYFQIGKMYVAIHGNDGESDFTGLISALRESEKKIDEYKQQIQSIKKITKCEKCGAEVQLGMAFCSACGTPVPNATTPPASENTVRCSGCGAPLEPNTRFCTSCGRPISQTPSSTAPAAPVPTPPAESTPAQSDIPVPETPSAQTGKKICQNCGSVLEDDVLFCTECGTKL